MIDRLGGFLQHNLVVCLAVVLIPLKIVILRLCGDSEALSAAFLAVPEDIGYVSLGVILGDVTSAQKAFRRHFEGSQNASVDLVIVVVINVLVAVLIHLLARSANSNFKGFRAAGAARIQEAPGSHQLEMPITATDDNIRLIQIRHLATFSIIYGIQITVAIYWLAWIAKVVAKG